MERQDGKNVTLTKDEIQRRYMDKIRASAPREDRKERQVCVIGCSPGNIGEAIVKRCNGLHMEVTGYDKDKIDVTDHRAVYSFFRKSDEEKFDTLVLANGYTHLDWFENMPWTEAYKIFDTTLVGSALAAQAWVAQTIDDPWIKRLVFIGSMAYRNVLNGSAIYCAAKAGLAHLTECLGWELTPKGYRVFCVHPSNVEGTPMTEKTIFDLGRYRGLTREQAEAYWGAVNLMPRWLDANDVAETVRHIVNGEHDYQSGSNIELRAGQR